MSDKTNSKSGSEAELRSAIVAFEQILDAEPNDRLALETLGDAYARMGDHARATSYLIRLGDVLISENDAKSAAEIVRRLKSLGSTTEILEAQKKLQEFIKKQSIGSDGAPGTQTARRSYDITREVSLAWDLLQAEEISQDDYATVVQDLSENSTKNIEVPVTVLHALQDRHFKHLEKVLVFLARSSGKPLISLAHFEIQHELVGLLPDEFMLRRGAIIFDKIGRDLLVAVLNPLDGDLQEDVRKFTDRRCHFCLTSAAEYDSALANIRKLQASLLR